MAKSEFMMLSDAIRIDRNALDTELQKQPELMLQVSNQVAKAMNNRDKAKADMEDAEADMHRRLSKQWAERDKMPTVKAQEMEVRTTDEYRDAVEDCNNSKAEFAKWAGLQEAFKQRSAALKELCNLYTTNYFTTDHVKTKAEREVEDEAHTRRRANASKARKPRTRKTRRETL